MKSYKSIEIKCFSPEEYQKAKEKAQKKQRLILQIDHTKLIKEKKQMKIKNFIKRILGIEQKETIIEAQKQIIRDAHARYDQLLQNSVYVKNLQKENENKARIIDELRNKILTSERRLEKINDQQYDRIKQLEVQLEAARGYQGKFYVFNPDADKPRKLYNTYEEALNDAKKVSNLEKGTKIYVLKLVACVENYEKIVDFALVPEERIPF